MVILPGCLVFLAYFTAANAFREAKDEEFPFQVSIQTLEKRHLCGGAILTPKWVLTSSACVKNQLSVRVCFGSADSNSPLDCIKSQKIHHQGDFNLFIKKKLALIELENPVKFSKTVKQATFPRPTATPRNTTKLSGWKVIQGINLPPSLYVSDSYLVVTENCHSYSGMPIQLDPDEFCGMDEESQNILYNLGSIVSKSAIVLGILTEVPASGNAPFVYIKLSEHGEWVKEILQSDAQHISWADEVPKDSAPSNSMLNLGLLGISAIFLHFI